MYINDKAYQREMIDTFLNSVYVYDDKIVFTYNFRDHAETVTLDEIEYVFCSDVNDCPPPINPRTVTVLGSFAAFIGIVGTFVLSQSVLVANPLRLCYTGRV